MRTGESTFRNYLFLWSGQLISLLGSSIASFVIIWWITLETESAIFLSIASLLSFVPTVVLSPFTGVLADRWNRKRLIGIVDFLQALATVTLIFLFRWNIVSIWHILMLLAVRGVLQAFHRPAVATIVPLMVPCGKLSRINGLNYLLRGAVALVGPVAAATLLEIWRIHQILWIDAATFLIAVIPLLIIKIPSVNDKNQKSQLETSFKEELTEGFTFLRNTRGLLSLILLTTVLNFLVSPVNTLMPYYIKFEHLGGAAELAFIEAFFQGGILAGGILTSIKEQFKKIMRAIMTSIYIIFLGYALIALTPTGLFWFMALADLITAFCIPIVNVSVYTVRQTVVPMKMQGRVASVMEALSSAAQPFGMILSGIIVEITKTSHLFLTCATLGIIITTLAWFLTDIRHVEKLQKVDVNHFPLTKLEGER